ncbi:carbohydrate esterase family 4 protein [Acidomyces richmondensis BFW]|nr:MAG: carbohydrate esterase family 4 protein [Acidomyces sp. 'richmondensis']KYG43885.1 carbohydrate esterase family 4 protein [Acidomyces richmondensis BFW]
MATQGIIVAIVILVVLPGYLIYKPPRIVVNYFQSRFPDVLFHIQTGRKVIALTIDDAPSPYTEQILEVLRSNDAHATFFVIGSQVIGREEVMANIVRQGNELGNHAMHDEPSLSLSNEALSDQILQVDSFINQAYNTAGMTRRAHYFRPGSGFFSTRLLDVVANLGYHTILGSIYPHDPFISSWRVNAWHILSMIQPGAVIICHDRRSWTVPMLQRVVPELKRRGYEIVTVSGLLDADGA